MLTGNRFDHPMAVIIGQSIPQRLPFNKGNLSDTFYDIILKIYLLISRLYFGVRPSYLEATTSKSKGKQTMDTLTIYLLQASLFTFYGPVNHISECRPQVHTYDLGIVPGRINPIE